MPTKDKYTFVRGPAHLLHGVRKGEELELTEAEVIDLTQRRFILEPADRRKNMPKVDEDQRSTTEGVDTR